MALLLFLELYYYYYLNYEENDSFKLVNIIYYDMDQDWFDIALWSFIRVI